MRIFGADSFAGKDTSLNAIPVNYIRPGDMCLVKVDNSDPMFESAVYYYEYVANDGNDENFPYVIVPLENQDTNLINPNLSGDDGGRWRLRNVYAEKVYAGELVTNTISPEVSGNQIFIGDDLTVGDHGIIVDGQVSVRSSIYEPPFVLTSSVMVEGLNANYLGGKSYDNFLKNDNNQIYIPQGVTELDVYMTQSMLNPPHYSVMIDISNIVDDSPSIYAYMITDKQQDYFTVKFSGIIDSPNYILHYFMIGDSDAAGTPPPPSGCCPPSGWPSGSPPPSAVYP